MQSVLALGAIIVTCSGAMAGPAPQPFQFMGAYNGHNYWYNHDQLNVFDAQAAAEAIGGTLVEFDTADEFGFVQRVQPDSVIAWIGLSDASEEGTFLWHSGAPVNFTFWSDNEPNDADSDEDHVIMNWGTGGSWNDFNAFNNLNSVVETPIPAPGFSLLAGITGVAALRRGRRAG